MFAVYNVFILYYLYTWQECPPLFFKSEDFSSYLNSDFVYINSI